MSAPGASTDPAPVISVVVPLFNEQENLESLYRRLDAVLQSLDLPYEILLVDDGSGDATPGKIDALFASDRHVVALHLSRNFGHQAAVSAGIDHARGQAIVVMDGDLQDPPEAAAAFRPEMARRLRGGLRRPAAAQGRPAQAGGLLRLLSDLESDQRPGHSPG